MNKNQIKILEEMRDNCREQLKVENSQKGMQYYLALNKAIEELKQDKFSFWWGFALGIVVISAIVTFGRL